MMQAGAQLRRLMFSMSTLEELGEVLSARSNFRENLRTALWSLMGTVPVSRGALLLHDARRRTLTLEVARGVTLSPGLQVPMPPPVARALCRLRRPVRAASPPPAVSRLVRGSPLFGAMAAALVIPLRFKAELVGVIAVGEKYTGAPYGAADDELIMVMANYIAIGIHNQELLRHLESANTKLRRKVAENRRLYRDLEGIYADTVRALGAAIDAKDPYTRGHSDRVARIAVAVARALGLPEAEVNALRIASHLHDVGKIAVDTGILQKPGRLSDQEMTQIHRHPTVSYDILSNIAFPYPDVALIARHHHERIDGAGYPDRLGSEALIPGIRIIAIADSFDAMTSDRPYRPALDLEEAIRRIREGVGVQFDPAATRAFLAVLRDEVSGSAPDPAIVPGLTRHFPAAEVAERLAGIVTELDTFAARP